MKDKFFSLQYKIIIFSFILVGIPLLSVGSVSYIKSSQIIEKKVIASNLNMVRQVAHNIEFILDDMHYISLYTIQNDEVRDFLKLSGDVQYDYFTKRKLDAQRGMMNLISLKNYLHSIYIEGFNGSFIDTKGTNRPVSKEVKEQIIKVKGKPIWMYGKNTVPTISLTRLINDINNISNALGIVQIHIDEEYISNIYKGKLIEKNSDFLIIDRNKKIISCLNKQKLGQNIESDMLSDQIYTTKDGYYTVYLNNQPFLITYRNIESARWTLMSIEPLRDLFAERTSIQQVVIWVSIFSFIICIIFTIFFSSKILKPLQKIRELMYDLRHENFDVQIDVKGNDEITLLCKSFNKMSRKLKKLTNEVYIGKIKQKEAELKALQTQINPHFLYNTLDTIYWMGRMEKAFETSKLVKALSTLFRLSLNKGAEFTTVRKEIEHLKSYITIQEKRYEDMIDFSFQVSDEVQECKVVKLVLQPLVENAIYHGIEQKGEKGNIDIIIEKQDDVLIYKVIDDGKGMNQNEMNQLLQKTDDHKHGFGIRNVHDRIKLYFGEQYGLEFHSEAEKGTTVIVYQPYRKENNPND